MSSLGKRLATLLFVLVASAFLAHGAALAADRIGCPAERPEAGAVHHADADGDGDAHSPCCAEACAIAMIGAELLPHPAPPGTEPPRRVATLSAIPPCRIDRPPRAAAA